MTGIETVAAIATVVGSAATAAGTIAAGNAGEEQGEYEAAQLDIKAKEEQAAAQQEAQQLRERKERALSSLTARSAASGFSATDPTALALSDEIERYGTLQEQLAQYGGKSRRAGLEAQATGSRISGKAAKKGSRLSAAGTILGGVSSLGKYGGPLSSSGSAPASYRYG